MWRAVHEESPVHVARSPTPREPVICSATDWAFTPWAVRRLRHEVSLTLVDRPAARPVRPEEPGGALAPSEEGPWGQIEPPEC
jgi:hypothetical protein